MTTYDAGMAVPDWPSTYGYNLFAYPWYTWITGPWDLFIEHGHRLFGALVGMIAIAVVIVTWRCEARRWAKWLALGALFMVVAQGCIGGLRVLLDNRHIAQLHGIVGPLFLGYAVLLVSVTSKWWHEAKDKPAISSGIGSASWLVVGLSAIQLFFGSQLRHVSSLSSRDVFALSVWIHVLVGTGLMLIIPALSIAVIRSSREGTSLRIPGLALSLCVLSQVVLGAATWITKFGMPGLLLPLFPNWTYTVQAEGMLGSMLATAHVANGALILAKSA